MPIDPLKIEVMDERTAEILRRKTPAESMFIGERLFAAARDLLADTIRSSHPDISDQQVRQHIVRHLHG